MNAAQTPQSLSQKFDALEDLGRLDKAIPDFIPANLSFAMALRPYQEKALKRYFFYMDDYKQRPKPSHALFEMATGSGKTVIMASVILDLYRRGYRNFMFFVNSDTIIKKTKENFLNHLSSKYLFAPKIKFDDKDVVIRAISNFDEANECDINIHFTTIQGLHMRLNKPSENAVTYEDFEGRKIVMISDEAHHINTMTKKGKGLNKEEHEAVTSWEYTVQRVFKSHPENLLFEFTATVELDHPAVCEKYQDKILYDYSLKQFREDGYSKDVDVLQADMKPLDRAFQAVILSQYRRKIAEANGLHIKPVILMKSITIGESKEIEQNFHDYIGNLSRDDIDKIADKSGGIIKEAFNYFLNERKIDPDDLIREVQQDFSPAKCLSVNSKEDSEEKQIQVNTLEDRTNEIRVVFAVDKLNEGWDVLNLFDIVRLYETRDSGKKTIQEAQLIGRGARYCPFIAPEENKKDLPKDKRKYDSDQKNDMRLLEQLYYHCAHNPKYIQEIRAALRQTGILADNTIPVEMKVKDSFRKSDFYKSQVIFVNKKITNTRENIESLSDYLDQKLFSCPQRFTGRMRVESLLDDGYGKDDAGEKIISETLKLSAFPKPVLERAIDSIDFFRFEKIRQFFPKLEAMKYFMEMEEFLASVEVEIRGISSLIKNLPPEEMLDIALYVLGEIANKIKASSYDYNGSKEFYPKPISEIVQDKMLKISLDKNSNQEFGRLWKESKIAGLQHIDLFTQKWFVYEDNCGTSEEKNLIRYISENSDRIERHYEEFYLIRNDKAVTLYNFEDGRAFEPDFILCAKKHGHDTSVIYQVFIEPKGGHLMDTDQ
jgi:type III restriction enzyme